MYNMALREMLRANLVTHHAPPCRVTGDDHAADVNTEQRGHQSDGLLSDLGRERLKRWMPVRRMEQSRLRESWLMD